MPAADPAKFTSFAEFYPFYLSEHRNPTCRRLHFIGSTLVLLSLTAWLITGNAWWAVAAPLCGYGFAWIGHFGFEKNRPASFRQPLYSLMGDWMMFWQLLTRRLPFTPH